jgi:hypothetical protein
LISAGAFPSDFRFHLTLEEAANLRFQFETSRRWGGRRYLPWAFTQEGVAMLSGLLGSSRAVAVNIEIMRSFVRLRQVLAGNPEIAMRLAAVEEALVWFGIRLSSVKPSWKSAGQ